MSARRTVPILCAVVALLVVLPAAARAQGNPLAGKRQWTDCTIGHLGGAAPYTVWPKLWDAQRAGKAAQVTALEKIAHVPQVKWLAGSGPRSEPGRIVGQYVSDAISPQWGGPNCQTRGGVGDGADPYVGDYPIFAIRQLDHEACHKGYDGGGAWNRARGGSYLPWIEKFVAALGPIDHDAAVILEPDGLPVIPDCLSRAAGRQRLGLMRATLKRLGGVPNLTTYIDIGSSSWLRKGQALRMLRSAGVKHVRGFALNTTHFNFTRSELRYGNWLAERLGKHFVVNTAENGRGPAKGPKNFCNPKNAGLGSLPTTDTASRYADAYLWISRPGLSSAGHGGQTQCSRGPGGNVFWLPKALQEASLAIWRGQPPWPARPL